VMRPHLRCSENAAADSVMVSWAEHPTAAECMAALGSAIADLSGQPLKRRAKC
jgi:hypothetical protein